MVNQRTISSGLRHARVADCMHTSILSCASDAPLARVASIMAAHRVQAVAITHGDDTRPIGVVSDIDLVTAAASEADLTALQAAATEPRSLSASESLDRAAQLIAEHGVAHLVVLDAAGGDPVGVRSTLDVAAAEQIARERAELARQAGFDADWRACTRLMATAAAILSQAETVGASAIVMGSRGLTGLKSLLLGSVSHGVVQRADRTVIVVASPTVPGSRNRNRHALETSSR